ncbi:MAG: nickel-dependent lactate racemase [Ruminococcaceae bacterium]|nr:nickel-dependent lactate racemase [Oscillospiraceae bacterium]
MQNKRLHKIVTSALFLALGIVLPLITGQIKEIGDSLLPMHIVVMLCGLICGAPYGLIVGLILPFLRSLIFSMPPLYPNAIWMALELATYGFVIGIFWSLSKKKTTPYLLASLGIAQISGRIVWGIAKAILLGVGGKSFTIKAFIVGGFLDALPGIILQALLIPTIISLIKRKEITKMKRVAFPYGKEKIEYNFKGEELLGVLESSIERYEPTLDEASLIKNALANPVGTKRLCELAKGKKNIVIIASDHTRPVPSKLIIPPMLAEIREASPDAKITILIATGCHRGTTKDELVYKFGADIVENENIYIHDCDERDMLVNIGTLPSGGPCEINKIACEADLLVSEGFIEPHFFAGFSGGRKSVLPGVCARETVLANHCSEFIANENCRTGILEDNPMHKDMLWAAKQAKLAFIVNVVLNADKKVIFATAGDVELSHKAGTDFLSSLCGAKAIPADVVITTNGGYPLDQNVYQAVKGMTAGEATVKKGGVIIMLAKSNDGIGGDHFYHQLSDEPDINKTMDIFLSRSRSQTVPDQWQTQVMLRVLMHASVIYISDMPDDIIEKMHMTPAHSIDEALTIARKILGKQELSIVAIPDGVSVIVQK